MNIRRFVAADMREALAAIRAELGADAVMLSSRKLPSGVEVIAAIDYDDSLLRMTGQQAAAVAAPAQRAEPIAPPPPAAAPSPPAAALAAEAREVGGDEFDARFEEELEAALGEVGVDGEEAQREMTEYQRAAARFAAAGRTLAGLRERHVKAEPERAPRPIVRVMPEIRRGAADPAAAGELGPSAHVADEIKDLRRLLETQLASLAWNDLNRQAPVRARLLREMAKLGVDAALAAQLANEIPADLGSQEALRALVKLFGERLPLVPWDIADRGGIFAVVGPTGVGKTTSIAKIAARFVLRHSVEELGLISTDTYRIGARQQLFNFARILRAPLHVAETSADMRRVLDGFGKKKLVLIDTAGMSQRDVRLANQFQTLKVDGHRVQTVLTLSAGADRGCLTEALKVFNAATPEALIVTKLDEATALGGVLSLAIRSGLPIAYLTDGQRVPEDLHLASPKRFWLMHNAVKLALNPAVAADENEIGFEFCIFFVFGIVFISFVAL
jgi:flagellar biosynthesis protein FlhF